MYIYQLYNSLKITAFIKSLLYDNNFYINTDLLVFDKVLC